MAQILELAHLVEEHGVPQVQVWCSRIKTSLDPQWPPALEALGKIFTLDDFVGATRNRGQRPLKLAYAFLSGMTVVGSSRERARAVGVNCVLTRNVLQTLDGKGVDAIYTWPLWYAEFVVLYRRAYADG
jgi:hypothetical protein